MVLGLTLAEIMLLLLFLMLLAAASLLLRRDGVQGIADDQARGLAAAKADADAVARRVVGLEAALSQAGQRAMEADQARSRAEAAASTQHAQARATIAGLANDLGATRSELQAVLGQNAQMRGEIQRIHGNAGSGLPYCWTTPDGKPIALLRVTLRDTGVIAQDPAPRPKPGDPLWTKLAAMPRDQVVPMERFLAQAEMVIAQSNSDRCRHALEVIDGTGQTNKRGYKALMNQLWGNFLLREVGG